MGEFFDPTKVVPHRCDLPAVDTFSGPAIGAGWRCHCGKAYVVVEEYEKGESWKQWRRSPQHDHPREAP